MRHLGVGTSVGHRNERISADGGDHGGKFCRFNLSELLSLWEEGMW
jgi:hypothetical protein